MLTAQELADDLFIMTGNIDKALAVLRDVLDSGRPLPADMTDLFIDARGCLLEMDAKANPSKWKQWS